MNCDRPADLAICRFCQQPLAEGEQRECPVGEKPLIPLAPAEIADILPGLDDPMLLGNCLEAAFKAIGLPPCAACKERREWLNKAHDYFRRQFGFAKGAPRDRPTYTLGDITIIVVSFIRFDCLRRFLTSARFHYPGVPVIVAEQSGERTATDPDAIFCRAMPGVTFVDLPFDSGLSASRNAAVKAAKTPLVFIADDDEIITGEAKLEALLDVLNTDHSVHLVSGLIRQASRGMDGNSATGWQGRLVLEGTTLDASPLTSKYEQTPAGTWYRQTDRYINAFLTTRQLLVDHPWDRKLKIKGEHLDHVMELKTHGIKAVYTPQFIVGEIGTDSIEYAQFRGRGHEREVHSKWGIKQKIGLWKAVTEPGIAKLASVMPSAAAPNIVLLTPGHTGSTVCAGLLSLLGWHLPDNDPAYNEPVAIREANDAKIVDPALLATLPQPWLIKDPRFCNSLEKWLPALAAYKPMLLWLQRDYGRTCDSWTRRNQRLEVLDARLAAAQRHYDYWPWAKTIVRFEDLAEWAGTFDHARAMQTA